MDLLSPPEPPPLPNPMEAAEGALARPLGQPALHRFLEPGDRVAVVAPDGGEIERLDFAVEAIFGAARRAGAGAIGLYTAPQAQAPHVDLGRASFGVMRALRPLAEADKLVVASRIALHPRAGFWGGGWSLASIAADDHTCAGLLASGALPVFLARLPPVFLLEAAFQRGGRPAALFAGALEPAHERASAYWGRWRTVDVGAGYDAAITELPGPAHGEEAILLAARALQTGGTLVVVGAPPETPRPALAGLDLVFADELDAARRMAEARAPGGRIAHIPDPLRTLLSKTPPDRLPSAT